MSKYKIFKKAVFIAVSLVCICAVVYAIWDNGGFLPGWIEWKYCTLYDSEKKYEITLMDRKVSVYFDSALIWTSSDEIKVQDIISCDMDNDKEDELILLCWKIGRYGSHRPFWVERDEKKWSQHIFVYEYGNDSIHSKWMSSYIGQDVASLSVNEDAAGRSRLLLSTPGGDLSCWRWDSWGFVKEDTDVSFTVFGDNIIHEPIYIYGLNNGGSFDFLFDDIKDIVAQSDVAVINQETPLTDDPDMYSGYPRFATPIEVGEAISDAGFDIVTCATNHALDKGVEGVNTTKSFFDTNNIVCLGIQSEEESDYSPYTTIVKGGIRFALFNYTYGTNGMKIPEDSPYMVHLLDNEDRVREDMEKAKNDADFIIVFVHWGTEYSQQPDDFQKKWAEIFLDCKVDVVVGTHPHTLQPYEVISDDSGHDMLIYYSIGNFVSAQPEESCIKGGMARFTVSLTAEGYGITEYVLEPLEIMRSNDGRYTATPCDELK
ncbi:MAG: CapA family protein [Lachnospiraceae bacterium]|nr:CapA family protein [Lachnospiraceae bacterium]